MVLKLNDGTRQIEPENVLQTIDYVRKHRGPLFMNALVKDDTWPVQVLKVDVLHFLRAYPTDAESPVWLGTNLSGEMYIHPQSRRVSELKSR